MHNVSREIKRKLEKYVEFLLKWNQKINLISKKTVPDVWNRHIFDCAELKKHIGDEESVVDLGAGAGLPGLVLEMMGVSDVVLVESDERKACFLREAKRHLGLNCEVVNERVEKIDGAFDVVVARGFASVDRILFLVKNIKCKRFLLLKGASVDAEVEAARKNWSFEYDKYEAGFNDGCVLEIKKVGKYGAQNNCSSEPEGGSG